MGVGNFFALRCDGVEYISANFGSDDKCFGIIFGVIFGVIFGIIFGTF